MSEEQIKKQLAINGIDAVMTIVLLDKQQERHYVPGKGINQPQYFEEYYRAYSARIQAAGYYMVTTRYLWESNFYDLASKKLLYSVQTQSFDPNSIDRLAHEYGQKIVQNMIKNKVLLPEAEKVVKAL